MQSTVAFFLTVLMFATPATQVLAQTPQQRDVPARKDVPPAQRVTLDVTPEQSLVPEVPTLPMTNPLDALLPPPNAGLAVALRPGADALTQDTTIDKKGILIMILFVVVLGIVVCVASECLKPDIKTPVGYPLGGSS